MNVTVNPAILELEAGEAPRSRGRIVKRVAIAMGLVTGLAAAASYGYDYWTVGQYLESTDDAYVKADYTIVAPKTSGYIAQVLVEDNTRVRAGQVLARIDDRDARAALDQAQANVEAAEAALRNLDAQIALQNSVIEQQRANVAATQAKLTFARQENDRYKTLLSSGYGTGQRAQEAVAALGENEAQLQRDRAALAAAGKAIDVLASERGKAYAEADRSRAALRQAQLNLSYTVITAPVDGTVGARSLRVGQYVQAGTQLMAVVPLDAVYVVANFKETQLAHVRSGQPVELAVDGFPGVALRGKVDSLSPASGLEFALLPPDNATGNFTKIVQRIPVKIAIEGGGLAGLLRAGMSVEPTIDTKSAFRAAQRELDGGRRIIVSR
ncbi:MAG: HlyD family efflux transporter periplasmic adaptor subunit [Mesorhizobium sp.]|uniref:HlyD family secretion protein n=1 Tax=unclassified Mesorhizobium TaxID=325217 RepID=UPI000F762EB7|nr:MULTISPECIES: HlyD family secretion protein [unclassified Mesorhizobium]RVC69413.1 HlyD family efflux transporter periplasmic adaptor subunit [Mesorhizobium sp. M00.F.Ca.ET.038.03.1.1]RVC80398.1 HlyD family efflux transporter periplasmic adaptor subunit [Mesorhizobium sp. M2A.F.Ca.ET.046.02.1.1]AZO33977.1 HlyD family secretion protein [Mesorhizobium sp. M2A.F.Ca.ET.046.03.2.1]RWB47068.1 MAG: HlyD family efflux transporter periplasmic adaptor subunit [Mesorhizobium sp.]RWE18245.1 MAG: HlyD f